MKALWNVARAKVNSTGVKTSLAKFTKWKYVHFTFLLWLYPIKTQPSHVYLKRYLVLLCCWKKWNDMDAYL